MTMVLVGTLRSSSALVKSLSPHRHPHIDVLFKVPGVTLKPMAIIANLQGSYLTYPFYFLIYSKEPQTLEIKSAISSPNFPYSQLLRPCYFVYVSYNPNFARSLISEKSRVPSFTHVYKFAGEGVNLEPEIPPQIDNDVMYNLVSYQNRTSTS